jgi:hypothetical protein
MPFRLRCSWRLAGPTPYGNIRMPIGSLGSASVALGGHSSDDTTSGMAITASVRPLGWRCRRYCSPTIPLLIAVLEARFEPVGLGDVIEQPGTLARNVGVQVQAELVDQVEIRRVVGSLTTGVPESPRKNPGGGVGSG